MFWLNLPFSFVRTFSVEGAFNQLFSSKYLNIFVNLILCRKKLTLLQEGNGNFPCALIEKNLKLFLLWVGLS